MYLSTDQRLFREEKKKESIIILITGISLIFELLLKYGCKDILHHAHLYAPLPTRSIYHKNPNRKPDRIPDGEKKTQIENKKITEFTNNKNKKKSYAGFNNRDGGNKQTKRTEKKN